MMLYVMIVMFPDIYINRCCHLLSLSFPGFPANPVAKGLCPAVCSSLEKMPRIETANNENSRGGLASPQSARV